MMRRTAVLCVVGAVLAGWFAIVWATWRGIVPSWTPYAAAPVGLILLALAHPLLRRRPNANDALRAWHDLRGIRNLTLEALDDDDCRLTLELVEHFGAHGKTATLQFDGVDGLRLQQLCGFGVHHGGLSGEALAPGRRDGLRYHVRDVHGEVIEFRCRSFEALTRSAAATPH